MFKCQQMISKTDDPAKQADLRAKVAKFDDQLETLEGKEKKRRLDSKKRTETREKTCAAVYAKEKQDAERAEKGAKAAQAYADRIAKSGDKVAAAKAQ